MVDFVTLTKKIRNCEQCPNCDIKRHYTGDSFETVFRWRCNANHDAIIATPDWNDPKPPIPAWCPLRKVSSAGDWVRENVSGPAALVEGLARSADSSKP